MYVQLFYLSLEIFFRRHTNIKIKQVVENKVDMQLLLQALFCRVQGSPDDLSLPDPVATAVARKAEYRFQAKSREQLYVLRNAATFPIHLVMAIVKLQSAVRGMLLRQHFRREYISKEAQLLTRFETISSGPSLSSSRSSSLQVILPTLE